MAVAAVSTTEAALENQRLGGLQLRVAALCTLVQICDGYDINSVAWAVPSLIRDWHLPPSTFAIAFLWSSIGIMVGALSAGPIGDRFGRRACRYRHSGLPSNVPQLASELKRIMLPCPVVLAAFSLWSNVSRSPASAAL